MLAISCSECASYVSRDSIDLEVHGLYSGNKRDLRRVEPYFGYPGTTHLESRVSDS